MWCRELFERQDAAYQAKVLAPETPRVVIELGVTLPWQKLAGPGGLVIGHDAFGASAPAGVIAKELGFTKEAIAQRVLRHLGR
jgi:transketolase